ncbi:MAG: hypothetical protein AAF218_01240 [Pseudomonadota bacterium]
MTHITFTRRARLLAWGACLILCALPLLAAVAIAQGAFTEAAVRDTFNHVTINGPVSQAALWLYRAEAMICFGLVLWTFYLLYEWLEACGRGHALEPHTARYALRLGQPLLGLAVLNIAGQTVMILALTYGNAAGERSLSIGIEGYDVMLLLAAAILTLFGYIQNEAARLNIENERFV